MNLKEGIKNNNLCYRLYSLFRYVMPYKIIGEKYSIIEIKRKFRKVFQREFDQNNPRTLNEKLQWLKINVHDDFHTTLADKYAVREYWKQFGEEGLIPLLYESDQWKNINYNNLPDVPCIVKSNSGSGTYMIIRDKNKVDLKVLQNKCKRWMFDNYYYKSQEWQYKNIKPRIIVEKLLLDSKGHIPNDYKFHFINGKLEFIYCSIDREGENYRSIYDPEWNRMDIEWVAKKDIRGQMVGKDIDCPNNFERMREIGEQIAKKFSYVRVDFYEVDGKLYYGEITLHHGSGFDIFRPEKYDLEFGKKLRLPDIARKK
ncbi:MAG: glycosyl transferase [Lachnospiraceae bacterium]|nr:glycosyl transferase [Lachnospiraceae bacterium]